MKTPKINWKKFMGGFNFCANEMDMEIKDLKNNKNGVSFILFSEDGCSDEVLIHIKYFSIIKGKILFEVVNSAGDKEIVSTPHAAFAVCYV